MMLPSPRVIVIDDEQKHLDGLTQGLNQCGTTCLPIYFTGESLSIPTCTHVRVIFADLHLTSGTSNNLEMEFSTIGELIENNIKPSGPYLIVLWTRSPEEAASLQNFLKERLSDMISKPITVQPLDKSVHLNSDGMVINIDDLVEAIEKIITKQPQIGALFNWEERVSGAAGDTVSSIVNLAVPTQNNRNHDEEVGRLLASLAVAAVGEGHVEEDRFRAVNEALLPILADRIATMRSRNTDNELWQTAFYNTNNGQGLKLGEAANLNSLIHIDDTTNESKGSSRGVVINLPNNLTGDEFEQTFGLNHEIAAQEQFCCKESGQDLQWVLVQTQAACDYAQMQPGPLPFHLGLCLEAARVGKNKPPAALWMSPCFKFDNVDKFLLVNARFQISLSNAKADQEQPLFRLREQLLNNLIYQLHSYGARPGITSFRKS